MADVGDLTVDFSRLCSTLTEEDDDFEYLTLPEADQDFLDDQDYLEGTRQEVAARIPFASIHRDPVPFDDQLHRRCFLPGQKVTVEITDAEQTSHKVLNPFLYTISLKHGEFRWIVRRRYKHFRHLHEQLMLYKAKLKIPMPTRNHKQRRKSFQARKQVLPRFPKRPDPLVRLEHMEDRKRQLQEYLVNVLRSPQYRNHPETLKFLEVSHLSFISNIGQKRKEGLVKKRAGGRRIVMRRCGCCPKCACNYAAKWHKRWLIVKDTFVAYVSPENGAVRDVLLMDKDFRVATGFEDTGVIHGVMMSNLSRHLLLRTWTHRKAEEWSKCLKEAASITGKDFTRPNRYDSFAPLRIDAYAHWFVDGGSYMMAVADALELAREEIFIADWWLSPELYLKRPITEGDKWRLDVILKRKANQGVKIFVLLYKEMEVALGINSYYTKQALTKLHPTNIKVLRHPDGISLWAHHEKCVVIDQRICFLGGVDLCYGRWDTPTHRLADPGSVIVSPSNGNIKQPTTRQTLEALTSIADVTNMVTGEVTRLDSPDSGLQSAQLQTSPSGEDLDPQSHINGHTVSFEANNNQMPVILLPDQGESGDGVDPVPIVRVTVEDADIHSSDQRPESADKDKSDADTEVSLYTTATEGNSTQNGSLLETSGEQCNGVSQDDDLPSTESSTASRRILKKQESVPEVEMRKSLGFAHSTPRKAQRPGDLDLNAISATPVAPSGRQNLEVTVEESESTTPDLETNLNQSYPTPTPQRDGKPSPLHLNPIALQAADRFLQIAQSTAKPSTPKPRRKIVMKAHNLKQDLKGRFQNLRSKSVDVASTPDTEITEFDFRNPRSPRSNDQRKEPEDRKSPDTVIEELGLEGSTKLWIGKDYVNFIFKDCIDLDMPFTDFIDRNVTPRMPWHDIAAVIYGKSARDVARHFIQRWNYTKLEKMKNNTWYPMLMPKSYDKAVVPPAFIDMSICCKCQVLRSACEWSTGIKYTEHSILNAYLDVIQNAKHYIYIENQFFISLGTHDVVENPIGSAIYERIIRAHRVKQTFRVFVILPLLPAFEGELGTSTGTSIQSIVHWNYASICRGQHSLIEKLSRLVPDYKEYISFYGLRNHGELIGQLTTELVYVHCKLLIADDNKAIIGSANINDRSMTGKRDSELAILVEDIQTSRSLMNGKEYRAGWFASGLRKALFREHLGLPNDKESDKLIIDPLCAEFYKGLWMKRASLNTSMFEKVFRCIPNDDCRTFNQLKEYQKEPSLAHTDPDQARELLKKILGHLVLLPLQFLCDENLTPAVGTKEQLAPTVIWT